MLFLWDNEIPHTDLMPYKRYQFIHDDSSTPTSLRYGDAASGGSLLATTEYIVNETAVLILDIIELDAQIFVCIAVFLGLDVKHLQQALLADAHIIQGN